MVTESKSISYKQFSIFISLSAIVGASLQVFIIYKLKGNALPALLGINFILIILIYYKSYVQNLPAFLIMINFPPLIYLNNEFHYSLNWMLLSSLPLILLFYLAVARYVGNESSISFSIKYMYKPIFLFSLFFLLIALIGIIQSQKIYVVIHQLFHLMLYLLVFPTSYFLTQRKYYYSIFSIILLIFLIISLEYILLNQFLLSYRFVTFQSGTLPLIIGPVFAFILYSKNSSKRIIATILLTILLWGAFITITRALWIATILTLLLSWFFYVKIECRYSYKKIFLFLLLIGVPLLFLGDSSLNIINLQDNHEQVEYKVKTIVKPLEDSSFLMRIELSYYSFQRFLESPLFGKGLGDYLNYKIFNPFNKEPQYYIDNSWFFILWKGGLLGFILFLWIYIRFAKSIYYIIVRTPNPEVKYICVGLLTGVIGLCFLGLFSPLLVKYKTIAIIAIIFAYVQFERNKISNIHIRNINTM